MRALLAFFTKKAGAEQKDSTLFDFTVKVTNLKVKLYEYRECTTSSLVRAKSVVAVSKFKTVYALPRIVSFNCLAST